MFSVESIIILYENAAAKRTVFDVWRGVYRCTHAKLAPLTPHPLARDRHYGSASGQRGECFGAGNLSAPISPKRTVSPKMVNQNDVSHYFWKKLSKLDVFQNTLEKNDAFQLKSMRYYFLPKYFDKIRKKLPSRIPDLFRW